MFDTWSAPGRTVFYVRVSPLRLRVLLTDSSANTAGVCVLRKIRELSRSVREEVTRMRKNWLETQKKEKGDENVKLVRARINSCTVCSLSFYWYSRL